VAVTCLNKTHATCLPQSCFLFLSAALRTDIKFLSIFQAPYWNTLTVYCTAMHCVCSQIRRHTDIHCEQVPCSVSARTLLDMISEEVRTACISWPIPVRLSQLHNFHGRGFNSAVLTQVCCATFDVFTTMIEVAVVWVLTPCSDVAGYHWMVSQHRQPPRLELVLILKYSLFCLILQLMPKHVNSQI
jgi:hypothetical protein